MTPGQQCLSQSLTRAKGCSYHNLQAERSQALPSHPLCNPVLGLQKRPEYLSCYINVTMSKQHRAAEFKQYQGVNWSLRSFWPKGPFLLKQSKGKSESERWAKSELLNCCFTCDGCCLKQDMDFLNLNCHLLFVNCNSFAWLLLTCYNNFLYSLIHPSKLFIFAPMVVWLLSPLPGCHMDNTSF